MAAVDSHNLGSPLLSGLSPNQLRSHTIPFPLAAKIESTFSSAASIEKSESRVVLTARTARNRAPRTIAFTPNATTSSSPASTRTLAWLWRATNLTMLATGCGLALVLHTADGYLASVSSLSVIAGSPLHIFPPLVALMASACLVVFSHRDANPAARQESSTLYSFMVVNTAFAVSWTLIEWVLRSLGLAATTRTALPLEALFSGITVLFSMMSRERVSQPPIKSKSCRHVLIVGTDSIAHDVRDYINTVVHGRYRFRGFITTAPQIGYFGGIKDDVAGHVSDFVSTARAMFVDEVIVAAPQSLSMLEDLVEQSRQHNLTLRIVPTVSEGLRRSSELQFIGSLPTIVAFTPKHRPISLLFKRILDLILGTIALVLLSPLFLVIALAVKLQSDGPIFYSSERVGVRGRGFLCYKFRTMVRDADSLRSSVAHLNERKEILFKISKDPRVTRLGAWLRKYSLDELPQLFNVLRGEMSLVGPRPSLRAEVIQYRPAHFRRLDVIPGMTGLWQVEARCNPSFDSYVALDCRYADNWSIWLDLKILLRTFRIVFLGTGV
jgi:exopolysaccharide biosynthesis polyprenyl glycosylphosphotransferase